MEAEIEILNTELRLGLLEKVKFEGRLEEGLY